LRGFPLEALTRQLEAEERLSPEEYDRMCQERLHAAIGYARENVALYRTPSWVGALAPTNAGIETWPVLEREELLSRRPEIQVKPRNVGAVTRRTSGSTGASLKVVLSHEAEALGWAHRYRGLLWHGIPVGARSLRLSHHLRPLRDFLLDQHCIPNLDTPAAIDEAQRYLTDERPPLVTGPPSMLFYLARCLRERGLNEPLVPVARVGGEQLFSFQRAAIERHLAARVVNSYGATETGAIAGECAAGSMHVYADHVFVEIFHGSTPAPRGEFGDIVLTALCNPLMPLVRYRIGDRGRLLRDRCRCGMPQPVLADLQARSADEFQDAGGALRHASELVEGLNGFFRQPVSDGVRQVQFEETDTKAWRIWAEFGGERKPRAPMDAALGDIVRRVVGPDARVEVRSARSLPRERGKFFYYRLRKAT
jgi:phenylacetate-CoA ligase